MEMNGVELQGVDLNIEQQQQQNLMNTDRPNEESRRSKTRQPTHVNTTYCGDGCFNDLCCTATDDSLFSCKLIV